MTGNGHAQPECRSCHAPVDWAIGPAPEYKRAPIDHDSADQPGGNAIVWRGQDGRLRWRARTAGEEPAGDEHYGMNHFATCPDAAAWKTKGTQQ